jgi:uncharacterized protein YjbJ (UPF0337 family)
MYQDMLKRHWPLLKDKVRERWCELTDAELEEIGGDRDRLLGVLQERYGLEREEAEGDLGCWLGEQEQARRAS